MQRLLNNSVLRMRAVASLISVALAGGVVAVPAYAQMSNAEVYEHVVKPQEEKRAGEVAAILARPSNWLPGEIRSNGNYGGIAWYQKGDGNYGYIVARGYISPTSAKVQMDIECYARKVTCEERRMLSNQWLAVGKRTDINHFVTASGRNRQEADAKVFEQCRKDGGSCIIQDSFDIMPHNRGITHMRPRVLQR